MIARRLASETNPRRGRALLDARFHASWFAEYGTCFSSLGPNGPLEARLLLVATLFAHDPAAFGVHVLAGAGVPVDVQS